jgi:ABC transporter substrate binding protein (PQQ-dependent alcohol dehydrogenase system)
MIRRAVLALLLAIAGATAATGKVQLPAASTTPGGAGPPRALTIGWLGLTDDPRHAPVYAYTRTELRPGVDPYEGAAMALADEEALAGASGIAPSLERREAGDAAGLVAALTEMAGDGERFVLVDLPGPLLAEVATDGAALPLTLINISAPENALRETCAKNLLHAAASDRMLTDALAQLLRARDWTRVLILEGATARDEAFAQSFADSAARLRIAIADRRTFTLARDPANREQNNPLLLTGGADYDVVFIADSEGEFARTLPYATQLARPVIGDEGLRASEWQWTFERYGAPQVNSRFIRRTGRHMTGADWAAWIATKSVIEVYARAGSDDPGAVDAYLRSDRLRADGSKGVTLSYRPWSGQLRQPIVLATADAVIAMAPLEGFAHRTNVLDTLGQDAPESRCR